MKNKQQRILRNPNGCWIYTGSKYRGGYGNIGFDGKYYGAHRLMYILFYGPFPKGKCILHRCDNPACVNPDHLFLGDPKANAVDRSKKDRGNRPIGEKNPHASLTEKDVLFMRNQKRLSRYQLAEKFHVTVSTINHAINGLTWKHLKTN